jgi:hypothetical protein
MSGKDKQPDRVAWLNLVAAGLAAAAIAAATGSPGSAGKTLATGDPAVCVVVTAR